LIARGHSKKGDQAMRALLLAGTAAIALSSAVYAQTASNTNHTSTNTLRSNLTQMLQKSGYSDIKVAPTSFMVRAKDSDGNAVVMSVSPDSFAEITNVDNTTATTGNAAGNGNGGTYVNVPDRDELSSKVVGLDIYNNDNKDIGTIKDIALDPNGRAAAYILSVGGFLGVGEHYVAVNPSDVKVTYNDTDKKWHASMNANADQLKSAPEFKYSGRWSGSRT
jgi:sporulation protein YlmC with PRC-barrel domain